jgi:hypothetical protein
MDVDTSINVATSLRCTSPDANTLEELAPVVAIDETAWPVWFRNGYHILREAKLGTKWESLLVKYVELEAWSDFVSPKGGMHALSSNKHPAEVKWWIGQACKSQLVIKDVPKFVNSFWTWWKGLQPKWQDVGQTPGMLMSIHQQGRGSWVELDKPVQNGFLTVVSLLSWWGQVSHTEAETTEWLAAIEDVDWVLTQMLKVPHK